MSPHPPLTSTQWARADLRCVRVAARVTAGGDDGVRHGRLAPEADRLQPAAHDAQGNRRRSPAQERRLCTGVQLGDGWVAVRADQAVAAPDPRVRPSPDFVVISFPFFSQLEVATNDRAHQYPQDAPCNFTRVLQARSGTIFLLPLLRSFMALSFMLTFEITCSFSALHSCYPYTHTHYNINYSLYEMYSRIVQVRIKHHSRTHDRTNENLCLRRKNRCYSDEGGYDRHTTTRTCSSTYTIAMAGTMGACRI